MRTAASLTLTRTLALTLTLNPTLTLTLNPTQPLPLPLTLTPTHIRRVPRPRMEGRSTPAARRCVLQMMDLVRDGAT